MSRGIDYKIKIIDIYKEFLYNKYEYIDYRR